MSEYFVLGPRTFNSTPMIIVSLATMSACFLVKGESKLQIATPTDMFPS